MLYDTLEVSHFTKLITYRPKTSFPGKVPALVWNFLRSPPTTSPMGFVLEGTSPGNLGDFIIAAHIFPCHQSGAEKANGFYFFNNIAIAAKYGILEKCGPISGFICMLRLNMGPQPYLGTDYVANYYNTPAYFPYEVFTGKSRSLENSSAGAI